MKVLVGIDRSERQADNAGQATMLREHAGDNAKADVHAVATGSEG